MWSATSLTPSNALKLNGFEATIPSILSIDYKLGTILYNIGFLLGEFNEVVNSSKDAIFRPFKFCLLPPPPLRYASAWTVVW